MEDTEYQFLNKYILNNVFDQWYSSGCYSTELLGDKFTVKLGYFALKKELLNSLWSIQLCIVLWF